MGTYIIKIYHSSEFTVTTFIQMVLWYPQKSLTKRHILEQVKYGALWRLRTAQMHFQHLPVLPNKHFLKYNSSWRFQTRCRHGSDMISLQHCQLQGQQTLPTCDHCSQRASAVDVTNAALRTTPTTTQPNTNEINRTSPSRAFKGVPGSFLPNLPSFLFTLSRMQLYIPSHFRTVGGEKDFVIIHS